MKKITSKQAMNDTGRKPFQSVQFQFRFVNENGDVLMDETFQKCEARAELRNLTQLPWKDVNLTIDNLDEDQDSKKKTAMKAADFGDLELDFGRKLKIQKGTLTVQVAKVA